MESKYEDDSFFRFDAYDNAPVGGLKVVAQSGWFAARPSGTENIYKIYAESFESQAHLNAIVSEAQQMVNSALVFRARG